MSALTDQALVALGAGPKTIAELARALGCQHNSVWKVLDPLRRAGRVTMTWQRDGHLRRGVFALTGAGNTHNGWIHVTIRR